MASFDPSAPAASDSGLFGLPHSEEEAALVCIPVPWEVTTSYGGGTAHGPSAILAASHQVDLFDLDVERPYEPGIHMLAESEVVRAWNEEGRALAERVIAEAGAELDGSLLEALSRVNVLSRRLDEWVYAESKRVLEAGKILAVVGGDHSTPFGAIRAAAERCGGLGVLHFDAHSDTRRAFEGFERSHASIMHNVLEDVPAVETLVQVGIRDVCEEEMDYVARKGDRVRVFTDRDLSLARFSGRPFDAVAADIVAALPAKVWVSFDIDGLDPRFCPHTGTPVPGGLSFDEAVHVLRVLARSGRTLVGFDLNEVAPSGSDPDDEWDGNVGARLLYKLAAFTFASQGRCAMR